MSKNKQRLTLLSRDEKNAALTGGVVDNSIPEDRLRECLERVGTHDFDVDAILTAVAEQAGNCRGFQAPGMKEPQPPAHMQPNQIKAQAEDTVAVIDELMTRIQHMNPELRAKTDDRIYRAFGRFSRGMIDNLRPDLYRIRAAIQMAGEEIGASARRGRKSSGSARDRACRKISEAIKQHSYRRTPARRPMPNDRAGELASDLLECCGL